MQSSRLFLSFWNLGLDNLPEGTFTHRRITSTEARRLIDTARQAKSLLCVSQDDLVAPYHQREGKQHEALRRELKDKCGIALLLEDFLTPEDPADGYRIINPLACVELRGDDRLMVVTCAYVLAEDTSALVDIETAFTIDPTTIAFHLIEAS